MAIKIAPSILSSDFANLEREMNALALSGADYAHIDVMDGHFVGNISIGAPVIRAIRRVSEMHLDVHLMISEPARYLDAFLDAGADTLTIHLEAASSEPEAFELIKRIRLAGRRPCVSIRPGTDVSELLPFLKLADMVLLMTVEPGFGGQEFLPGGLSRIRSLRAMIEDLNPACELEIDGGITVENIAQAASAGANVIVAGSAIFKNGNISGNMLLLREACKAY